MKKTTDFRKTSIVVKNGRLALLALPVLHHCLVSRFGCHIVCQLSAADFKHPCLKLWASIIAHPCAFMNALMALRPCKAFGVHFIRRPCLTRTVRVRPPAAPKIITPLVERVEVWRGVELRSLVVGASCTDFV